MRTTESAVQETTKREMMVTIGVVVLLILLGAVLGWWGYSETTDAPETAVRVHVTIYVHDIPRETAPRSAIVFRALSPREQEMFLTAYTSPDDQAWETIRTPSGTPFQHLAQNKYVQYHGRWFSITTEKTVTQFTTATDLFLDLVATLTMLVGMVVVFLGGLLLLVSTDSA